MTIPQAQHKLGRGGKGAAPNRGSEAAAAHHHPLLGPVCACRVCQVGEHIKARKAQIDKVCPSSARTRAAFSSAAARTRRIRGGDHLTHGDGSPVHSPAEVVAAVTASPNKGGMILF